MAKTSLIKAYLKGWTGENLQVAGRARRKRRKKAGESKKKPTVYRKEEAAFIKIKKAQPLQKKVIKRRQPPQKKVAKKRQPLQKKVAKKRQPTKAETRKLVLGFGEAMGLKRKKGQPLY